ncbi:uncharacterized protein LOC109829481 isoform X2 [Asparagus officinalis]|uniref:uncharacterized protein LOC109829481 isoform X2 n=1 Tax=Asparagus officinalis TaxID=4686 RepID=UPI00098E7B9F|nr:uncharacterized protein LOC109829481 isoform X2 [Asparagus officinalis]
MDLVSLEERSNVAFSNDDSPPPRLSISTSAMTDVMKKAEEEEEIGRKLRVKPEAEELPGSPSFRFYFQQASAIESFAHDDRKEEVIEKSNVQQRSCKREESITSSHSNTKEESTKKYDGENSSSASHSNEEPIAIGKRDEGCASSSSNETNYLSNSM